MQSERLRCRRRALWEECHSERSESSTDSDDFASSDAEVFHKYLPDQSNISTADLSDLQIRDSSRRCSEISSNDFSQFPPCASVEDVCIAHEEEQQKFYKSHLKVHRLLLLASIALQCVAAVVLPHLHEIPSSILQKQRESFFTLQSTQSPADNFFNFTESHADSHPHIHANLSTWMYSSVLWSILHLVFIRHLETSFVSRRLPKASSGPRMYGLFCFLCLIVEFTGTIYGGLDSKSVLFPDTWIYVSSKLTHLWAAVLFPDLRVWPEIAKRAVASVWIRHTPLSDPLASMHTPLNFIRSIGAILSHANHQLLHLNLFSIFSLSNYKVFRQFIFAAVQFFIHFSIVSLGLAIDLKGMRHKLRASIRYSRKMDFIAPAIVLSFLLGVGKLYLHDVPGCTGSDYHWYPPIDSPQSSRPFKYTPEREPFFTSKYIEMPDGVELAADIFFPRTYVDLLVGPDANPSEPLPTFVDITRYNRRMTVRWPFSLLRLWGQPRGSSVNVYNYQIVQSLTANGYVVVVVDTRGSGSSFGYRAVDFSPLEVADFANVVSWVKEQFWSDGKIATGGVSYDGMTGIQAASQGNVQATLALFTPMDVVSDMLQPGGIVCSSFLKDYTGLTLAFEKNGTPLPHFIRTMQYPLQIIAGFSMAFGITAPVKGRESDLSAALAKHQKNWNMQEAVRLVHFKDDKFPLSDGRFLEVKHSGITSDVLDGLVHHNVSVYAVGGYCDSSGVRGSTRLHTYMRSHQTQAQHKLIVGPWTHTGRRNCSPYSSGSYACFEKAMYYDVVRFLDCQLKGDCWGGIREELQRSSVHYWQVGAEEWRSSDEFPPKGAEYVKFSFSKEKLRDSEGHLPTGKRLNPGGDWMRGDWSTAANEMADFFGRKIAWSHSISGLNPWKVAFENVRHLVPYLSRQSVAEGTQKVVKSQSSHSYRLTSNRNLESNNIGYIEHNVSYDTTSGVHTRWIVAQHPFRGNVEYHGGIRALQDDKYLSFTSDQFQQDQEVVGSPWLMFHIDLRSENSTIDHPIDVSVFAYLEDIETPTAHSPEGVSHYVTEGRTLLSHRPLIRRPCVPTDLSDHTKWIEDDFVGLSCDPNTPIGSPEVVTQPGTRSYMRHSTGGIELITLTLEPIAWTFKRGHSLRISLSGADVDNFEWKVTAEKADVSGVLPAKWKVPIMPSAPAWLALPVAPSNPNC